MPGLEDVFVEWAPTVAPLATVTDGDWAVLPHWQSVKTTGGQVIEDVTQQFTVGTATIRLRNGDTIGNVPTFLPPFSQAPQYRGLQIRVRHETIGVIWTGRIDRIEFHFENTPFAAFVTLHCVDTIGNLSDLSTSDLFVGGGATVDGFTGVFSVEDVLSLAMLIMGSSPPSAGEFSHQLVKAPDKFESRQDLIGFLNEVLLTEGAALSASPVGDLTLRGRWGALRRLNDAAPTIVFTDQPPDTDLNEYTYRRDDLQWSDTVDDYCNSVQTRSKYLGKTFTEEELVADYPKIQMSRTELPTIRQGWVEANARMWLKLNRWDFAYPKKLKFMVASPGVLQRSILSTDGPNLSWDWLVEVRHTPPGDTERTYRVAINLMEHDIDRQRWLCTLGFASLDNWWNAYGNGNDPIEMIEIDGDADHGIDSDAIIAP